MARVFAVMVGVNWAIRVSRYIVDKWPGIYFGYRELINRHWRSVAVGFVSEPEISHVAGV